MSRRAEMLVWERSRAKGSNLLVLLVLADCAQHDGRDAWPSVKYLAQHARLTVRGVRFVLAKLHADGEIVTEANVTARPMTAGARQIIPPWFIHVRCVCDWPLYRGKDFPDAEGKDFPADGKDFPDGGKPATALYKEEILEQEDPRTEIQEPAAIPPLVAAAFTPEQAFAHCWNDSTTDPILPCVQLTAQRRRHIRKRLRERPLTAWVDVFRRVEASAFCRGQNERGWVADFAWIIGSADVAVKVLEGKYDTRIGRERPFTATELADAKRVITHMWGGCRHDPACGNSQACAAAIIRQRRRDRGEAA